MRKGHSSSLNGEIELSEKRRLPPELFQLGKSNPRRRELSVGQNRTQNFLPSERPKNALFGDSRSLATVHELPGDDSAGDIVQACDRFAGKARALLKQRRFDVFTRE